MNSTRQTSVVTARDRELRISAEEYARPRLPTEYKYALIRDFKPGSKPVVFPDLLALGRSLHRLRGGASFQLQDMPKRLQGEEASRLGVLVYTRDADRWVWRCLGWAWLNGDGYLTLRAALHELEPDLSEAGADLERPL